MKSACVILLCITSVIGRLACATDLVLELRPHAREVVFGDPLYVEVKIYNRGKEAIVPTPEYYPGDRFRFEIRDNDSHQVLWYLFADGQPSPNKFDAREMYFFHQYVFLPGLHQFNRGFWLPVGETRSVSICGVYRLSKSGLELRSQWRDVRVIPRDEGEMKTLEHWAKADVDVSGKGISPASLGVDFLRPLDPPQVLEVSRSVKSGELGELLRLTSRLQSLHAELADSREAADRALVQWLKGQPHIKRQALVKQLLSVTEGLNMTTTRQALRSLDDEQ